MPVACYPTTLTLPDFIYLFSSNTITDILTYSIYFSLKTFQVLLLKTPKSYRSHLSSPYPYEHRRHCSPFQFKRGKLLSTLLTPELVLAIRCHNTVMSHINTPFLMPQTHHSHLGNIYTHSPINGYTLYAIKMNGVARDYHRDR